MIQIILASSSKPRQKVLNDLGLKFTVIPSNIDERGVMANSPFELVTKLARLKAEKVLKEIKDKDIDAVIIAADSMAIIEEKKIQDQKNRAYLAKYRLGDYILLNKPESLDEAIIFLTSLSNTTHYFITGLYVIDTKGKVINQTITKTKLTFNKLTLEEIKDYVNKFDVLNHAGAYHIEIGTKKDILAKKIEGSYTNVLGLPIEEINKALGQIV